MMLWGPLVVMGQDLSITLLRLTDVFVVSFIMKNFL